MTSEKNQLRKHAREKRRSIPEERRKDAGDKLAELLEPRLKKTTLSFASFADEIDLWPLNERLCKKGLLVLPGEDHTKFDLFLVEDLEALKKTKKGYLAPREDLCKKVALDKIAFVLVPALAFDEKGGRIGYGGGYYDRLLAALGGKARKIGVGYVEQQFTEHLPHEPHDVHVDELILI